jgi:hypothetical protein
VIQRVKDQRGLARSRHAGDDRQAVAEFNVNPLQVVLIGTLDVDRHGNLFITCSSNAESSILWKSFAETRLDLFRQVDEQSGYQQQDEGGSCVHSTTSCPSPQSCWLTCLNAYTPQRIGHLVGIGQMFNPPDSIGTAVQPQVVIKRTNGTELSRRAGLAALTSTQDHLQMQTSAGLPRAERSRL